MSILQPTHQFQLACLTQVRPRSQSHQSEQDGQAQEGGTVVGNLEKALGDVGCESSQASGSIS
jgi:hypothetical protein